MTAQRIYDTVADDFSRVNDLIIKRLSSDVPLVEKIAQYIIESGGKRLRPLLVLLSSRALGYERDDHLKLAAVIEFLHTATLLHDDVVGHLRHAPRPQHCQCTLGQRTQRTCR